MAADLSAIGGPKLETTIAPVHLNNLGGSKGSTPGKIGATVAGAFAKSVLTAVSRSAISGQLTQLLGKGIGEVNVEGAKDLVKGLLGR